MTQRAKLEFAINTPTEITLLYDEPVTGTSQYGVYNLYAVESNGLEFSLFAPDVVHEQIKNLSKGQSAIITKLAAQRGNKVVTAFDVVLPKPVPVANEIQTNTSQQYVQFDNTQSEVVNEKGNVARDKSYDIMLGSLKDAISISSELGGTISAERVAITLFIHRSKSNNNYGG